MRAPMRCSASTTTGRTLITPMDPTSALGKARIRLAPQARKYAPEAPTPLIHATTGLRGREAPHRDIQLLGCDRGTAGRVDLQEHGANARVSSRPAEGADEVLGPRGTADGAANLDDPDAPAVGETSDAVGQTAFGDHVAMLVASHSTRDQGDVGAGLCGRAHYAIVKCLLPSADALRRRRRAERGANAIALAAAVVVALAIVVVAYLLLRTPTTKAVVGVQANPSVSASPTATPAPSTPPPTEAPTAAPTATPTPTPPTTAAFVGLSAPQRIACKGQSTVYPHMTWSVVNATGITISIDLPGGVFNTYGTSGASDQQDSPVPFACSGSFKHTYYFATVGSVGPVSNRTVVITATP